MSRYRKGKTNLDFTEGRDSEWQWHQLGHMQVYTLLQTDNHASTQPLRDRIGRLLNRAVRHLAAHPFGSDRWLHRPRWVGWLVRYLDIHLFYVCGSYSALRLGSHGTDARTDGRTARKHNDYSRETAVQLNATSKDVWRKKNSEMFSGELH